MFRGMFTVITLAFAIFQVSNPPATFNPTWAPLNIGAGGQWTAFRGPYPDGTVLNRNDTMGAYEKKNSGTCTYGWRVYSAPCWKQLVTATSIGSAFSIDLANGGGGVIEIAAAPSNTLIRYMAWQGFLWVTKNGGDNWFKTTLTFQDDPNNNNAKERGPRIAVDPNDPDTVYIGRMSGGSSVSSKTTNGTASANSGTTTFTTVTGIGSPITYSNLFIYEQGSSSHIITGSYNIGFYESTNSGASWSGPIASMPSTFSQIFTDKFGQFWIVQPGGSQLWRYASGVVTALSPGGSGVASFVADPASASAANQTVVVAYYTGQPNSNATNGTGTWSEASRTLEQTFSASGSQPGWLGVAAQGNSPGPNLNGWSMYYDASSNLYFAGGLGGWKTAAPLVTNGTAWTADSLGVEQLVGNKVLTPPGSPPTVAVWDKGNFQALNPDAFPSNYWRNVTSTPITGSWDFDYASSDPTFVSVIQYSNISSFMGSGKSTDGGKTFARWASDPTYDIAGNTGGNIAILNSTHWITASGKLEPLTVTTNGGASFANVTITGTPTGWTVGSGVGFSLVADRVTANTYCMYNPTNTSFYYSTNAGVNGALSGITIANLDGAPNAFSLKSVPGQAFHYLFTAGEQSGAAGAHPALTHLWRLTKTTNPCDTATSLNSNLNEVVEFGFGALPPAGGAYAVTIYAYAWLNNVLGFYQSTDGGTTWTAINVPASQTPYPLNSADFVSDLSGDPDIYGRINVAFRGSGFAYIDTADACPWIAFTNIVANQALTGSSVTLTAHHSGLVPVTGVKFFLDGSTQIGATQTGQSSYSVSFNASGQTPGAHTLTVRAEGNGCTTSGNSKTIPITTSSLEPANDNSPMWLEKAA